MLKDGFSNNYDVHGWEKDYIYMLQFSKFTDGNTNLSLIGWPSVQFLIAIQIVVETVLDSANYDLKW